jgi:N-sulfoglucosamine sulfohydrolase
MNAVRFFFTILLAILWFQPQVMATDRPNILFCIADDWGLHAGAYGTPWVKTPAFDRVAKDGLLFSHAYTPNAKCAPSRACLLTGRNSWQIKEAANHICYFPPEFKGWAEALAENGWNVGHTLKGWGPGVAKDANGHPRKMTGDAYNKRKSEPPAEQISNNDYAGNFAEFLDEAPPDKPWCFWYGAIEPHRGYEFGVGVRKGGKTLTDVDHVPACWPDTDDVRNDMLDYAFEVEHFDKHVGLMLVDLKKRGLLENTLVIVTSDHGPPFPRGKGNVYELANHVPLAMMWPKGIQSPGRVVNDFVSFVDIAPTLIDVAGLSWQETAMAPTSGHSLTDIFQPGPLNNTLISPVLPRDHVLLGKERTDIGRPHDEGYPTRGIVTDEWLYVENFEASRWPGGNPETGYMDCDAGKTKSVILHRHRADAGDPFWALCFGLRPAEELYNLKSDPDCVQNLSDQAAFATQKAELRDKMTTELRAQDDPRMFGKGAIFDEYEHATKSNVGFYERFVRGDKLTAGWIDPDDIEPSPISVPDEKRAPQRNN